MENAKARISKRTVDGATPPVSGEVRLWDTQLTGFFLRVYPSGRKVYAVRYRLVKATKTFTIGVHGSPFTADTARAAAEEILRRVNNGEDPMEAKKEARHALTVGDLIDRYLADGPATKPGKRESTWSIDASNLNRHIRFLLGRRIAGSITKADAARAVRDIADGKTAREEKTGKRGLARITGGEGTARRTRTTAAAMFAWGCEHGLVKDNPFAGVKLTAAKKRERFLTRDEARRLLDAIQALESENAINPGFADAMRLLLLTGARKSEILGLRWAEVDLHRGNLILPPERTKAGGQTGERVIPLGDTAIALLEGRREYGPKYVFPAASGGGHAVGLRKAFVKVCARTGFTDLRIHDLRHSYASLAIANGASLYQISKLLGHANSRTTERYAHLANDPLREIAAGVGEVLG